MIINSKFAEVIELGCKWKGTEEYEKAEYTQLFHNAYKALFIELSADISNCIKEITDIKVEIKIGRLVAKSIISEDTFVYMVCILADRIDKGIEDTPATLVNAWKEYFNFSVMEQHT